MLDLTEKVLKVVVLNMFTELKETITKGVKKGFLAMLHHIENINKETEILFFFFEDQIEILGIKIQ